MKKVALAILALGFGIFGIGIVMGLAHTAEAPSYAFGGCLVMFIGLLILVGTVPDPEGERRWKESMEAHREAFNNQIRGGK